MRMKLFPWRERPQTETTPIGPLTMWRAAMASGSIWNFPWSSQYTSRRGRAGPSGTAAERLDLGLESELDAPFSFSPFSFDDDVRGGEAALPLKNRIIFASLATTLRFSLDEEAKTEDEERSSRNSVVSKYKTDMMLHSLFQTVAFF